MNEHLEKLLKGLSPLRLGIRIGFFYHHTAIMDSQYHRAPYPVFNQIDFFVRLGVN